jgi:nitrogen fixation/metabolism regulation signal transduction histidine kinase
VDLNQLITDVLGLYAPENSIVPVDFLPDSLCPAIQGDAQQLRQVVHNLLQNAQDASLTAASGLLAEHTARSPRVQILTQFNAQSSRVRLIVKDAGTGFAPHILQRAFEPYVTTKSRGTGLGLAVVKKIADEHGARIEISNLVDEDLDSLQKVTDPTNTQKRKVIGAQVILSFPVV